MAITDNERIMIKVCELYYKDNLSQKEISYKLGISRPQISRIFLTLELNIKKTVGNTRLTPCFQRFFCTLILDSSLNSILLHSETESKSCSV